MLRWIALLAALVLPVAPGVAGTVTVSAAVSLKDALEAIAEDYEARTGEEVRLNLGASGQLMAQVAAGAPVDLFISAAPKQADELIARGLAMGPATVVARNRMVLIVPAGAEGPGSFEALGGEGVKRVAVGQPRTVPAGEYAMQVLGYLGLTEAVRPRLVYGSHVRQVLDYVARGEVDAGLVYATDATVAGGRVKVVAAAPEGAHDPIVYPAVVIKDAAGASGAERFLGHLLTPAAQEELRARGFGSPAGSDGK